MLCGRKLFPYQVQFAKRIVTAVLENDENTITALMARQCGKSFTVSAISSALMIILPIMANMPLFYDDKRLQMFRNGMKMGIYAPALSQAQIIFNNIKDFISSQRGTEILSSEEFNISLDTLRKSYNANSFDFVPKL